MDINVEDHTPAFTSSLVPFESGVPAGTATLLAFSGGEDSGVAAGDGAAGVAFKAAGVTPSGDRKSKKGPTAVHIPLHHLGLETTD